MIRIDLVLKLPLCTIEVIRGSGGRSYSAHYFLTSGGKCSPSHPKITVTKLPVPIEEDAGWARYLTGIPNGHPVV